ncbi:glycosyltransferase family 2 protein [Candidatus Cerribacteria bacterium 'Amazon FNV 2010 28 9']|uniref:Glycosyltransferase family 2 protein n=1 Tax=Candidatus Cerribacteria bacterium 'Amazon FNV 2010 28 9' TaxID=2081795 RepID=A0A317JMY9_9BACT|nr:MAG: glycosyltransferase family 2 protein [Candidatus Cerribacteria bacterium 'Amazon FNV 2010 28 9']
MATKLDSLSVFFPAFNEEENIGPLLESALTLLPQFAQRFEIIVVNDGSTDRTRVIALEYHKTHPNVRVVSHSKNKGYGASLKTGIKHAKYDWIFWTDGDLQFDLASLKIFVQKAKDNTAIIGYRKHRADTFIRKLNGELYTQLINFLFHMHVRDIDCAFKLIPSQPLQNLLITSSGAFTSAEILIRLHRQGVEFIQLPVPHFPRKFGTPTGGNIKVIFRGLKETLLFFIQKS